MLKKVLLSLTLFFLILVILAVGWTIHRYPTSLDQWKNGTQAEDPQRILHQAELEEGHPAHNQLIVYEGRDSNLYFVLINQTFLGKRLAGPPTGIGSSNSEQMTVSYSRTPIPLTKECQGIVTGILPGAALEEVSVKNMPCVTIYDPERDITVFYCFYNFETDGNFSRNDITFSSP